MLNFSFNNLISQDRNVKKHTENHGLESTGLWRDPSHSCLEVDCIFQFSRRVSPIRTGLDPVSLANSSIHQTHRGRYDVFVLVPDELSLLLQRHGRKYSYVDQIC